MRNFLIATVARNLAGAELIHLGHQDPTDQQSQGTVRGGGTVNPGRRGQKSPPPATDWAQARFPGQCGSDPLLNRRATG
jgi:hypothetical protein